MVCKKIVLITGILATFMVQIIKSNNELFCKYKALNYHICRVCTDLDKDCETTKDCQCNHIQLYDEKKGKFVGGSNCESTGSKGNWCFVSSTSPCVDKRRSSIARRFENIWYKNEIYGSFDACKPKNRPSISINQEVMVGTKIIKDVLIGFDGYSNNSIPLEIETGDHIGCQEECKARCGKCGAWSFDDLNGICYLHTADACCGQVVKRQSDANFISGYNCQQCSSSHNDCPCSLKQRIRGGVDCAAVEQGSGGTTPQYLSSSGKLEIHRINSNVDPCACEKRTFKRRRISKCRCVKPQCKDEFTNPNGTCEDKRRCREIKLSQKRFPSCGRQVYDKNWK